MGKRVNDCLNKVGLNRKGQHIVQRLQTETAERLEVGDKM